MSIAASDKGQVEPSVLNIRTMGNNGEIVNQTLVKVDGNAVQQLGYGQPRMVMPPVSYGVIPNSYYPGNPFPMHPPAMPQGPPPTNGNAPGPITSGSQAYPRQYQGW